MGTISLDLDVGTVIRDPVELERKSIVYKRLECPICKNNLTYSFLHENRKKWIICRSCNGNFKILGD